MIYKGTILTGEQLPIPGSAVFFKTDTGETIVKIPTDPAGNWEIDSSFDDGLFQPGIVAYFAAPGWGHYSIESDLLPATFNVTLQKQRLQPWVIALITAAVAFILFGRGKKGVGKIGIDDVKTVVFIIGGLFGIAAVSKILKMLGLLDDPKDKALDDEAANPLSPWNPNLWISNGAFRVSLSEKQAEDISEIIYDEIGVFWDNEDKVIAAIKQAQTKADISYISWIFSRDTGRDLLTWLREGPGSMPWHGLSSSQVTNINNFVYQLPNY